MDRINRIPWELGKHLDGNEYKMLDYLLFRSNNQHGWKFWTSGISTETGICIGSTFNVLQRFVKHGFVTQDASHHYHFDYNNCMKWIRCLLSGDETDLLSGRETIVSGDESTQKKVQNTVQNKNSTDYLLSGDETKQNGAPSPTLKREYVPRRYPGETEASYKTRITLPKKLDLIERMKGGQQ